MTADEFKVLVRASSLAGGYALAHSEFIDKGHAKEIEDCYCEAAVNFYECYHIIREIANRVVDSEA